MYTDDRRDAAHSPSVEKFLKDPSPASEPCKRTAGVGEELQGEVEVIDKVLMWCFRLLKIISELYAITGWLDTSARDCGGSEW